jgi:arylsulfatase A-like enzyme
MDSTCILTNTAPRASVFPAAGVRSTAAHAGALATTALAAGVLLVLLAGCGRTPPRPNILLVVIDTLRSDYCSCYGYPAQTTPALDTLAQQGIRFESVYSPMPTTNPAHAALFTSRPPIVLGVLKNGHVLPSEAATLAEVLRREGYETAAFVSAFPVKGRFGFAQGFDVYDDDFTGADSSFRDAGLTMPGEKGNCDRRAHETTKRALEWLRGRKGDRPFFLWVHTYDPHFPYNPPPEFAGRFLPAGGGLSQKASIDGLYCGELLYADTELGRLVTELDRTVAGEDLLVIVTSDHGEGLLQHDWMGHGLLLYEEAVRVPLVMRWPGVIEPGAVVEEPVELTDVAPTILSLLEIDAQELQPMGRVLLSGDVAANGAEGPESGGREDPGDRPIFLQRRLYEGETEKGRTVKGEKYSLVWRNWKYIEAAEEETRELYDLARDPGELDNVIEKHPQRAEEMARALKRMIDRLASMASGKEQVISEEDAERLKTIGYGR